MLAHLEAELGDAAGSGAVSKGPRQNDAAGGEDNGDKEIADLESFLDSLADSD